MDKWGSVVLNFNMNLSPYNVRKYAYWQDAFIIPEKALKQQGSKFEAKQGVSDRLPDAASEHSSQMKCYIMLS